MARIGAGRGGEHEIADEILEPYVCDRLGVTPIELQAMEYETVMIHLAYLEGRDVARWAAEHPRQGQRGG